MPLLHRETGLVARTFPSIASLDVRPPSAAQVLASILDLDASVKLAHCLADDLTPPEAPPPMLRGDYVRKRLEAIDDTMTRRLARPFDPGRASLPDRNEVHAQIVEMGAGASKEAVKAFAVSMGRAHRDWFMVSVGRARAEIRALREEVTEDLRQLGAKAARLEEIDAIVRGSIDDAMGRLVDRAALALEAAFVPAFAEAVTAVDVEAGVEAIAPWFADRGVIAMQIARTRDVTRSLLAHEAAVLEALVDSACRAAGDAE